MTLKEAEVLVENWYKAVSALWGQVLAKAQLGTVGVPILTKDIGGIRIILSKRGIEVVVGSNGSSFSRLLTMPEFKVSEFPNIRKFVVDSIRQAHIDIDTAIEERKEAFGTSFNDLKKEIAEWNLTCEQGKEMRP